MNNQGVSPSMLVLALAIVLLIVIVMFLLCPPEAEGVTSSTATPRPPTYEIFVPLTEKGTLTPIARSKAQ